MWRFVLLCAAAVQLNALKDSSAVSVPTSPCTISSDCYPAGLNGSSVPTKYINCYNQKCVCSDCFYAANSYKSCAFQRCWEYDNTAQTCNDLRKDQRTAFLLSLFLSALGAANFYIEQYVMGGIQLAILLVLPFIFLFICISTVAISIWLRICFPRFETYCYDDTAVYGPMLVLSSLWILLMLMWWVSDLFTFAENLRVSGNGCPLRQNL